MSCGVAVVVAMRGARAGPEGRAVVARGSVGRPRPRAGGFKAASRAVGGMRGHAGAWMFFGLVGTRGLGLKLSKKTFLTFLLRLSDYLDNFLLAH